MPDCPIKILIVDDDEEVLIATMDLFKHVGFKVFGAPDANTALEIFQKQKPQICLVEVIVWYPYHYSNLMREKGFKLINKLKEMNPKAKVIAFASCYPDREVPFLVKEFGADDFIKKPADPWVLIDKLNIMALELSLQEGKP
jgi:DNA-binding response OmpR family regulator